jgi:hypothetical protein
MWRKHRPTNAPQPSYQPLMRSSQAALKALRRIAIAGFGRCDDIAKQATAVFTSRCVGSPFSLPAFISPPLGDRKMRKTIAAVLFLASMSFAFFAFATAQQGDVLVWKGKKYFIYTNPLRAFLETNPGKLPKSDVVSTSNWRGYVATWAVNDDRLVLTDVGVLQAFTKPGEGGFSTELRSVISELFPGQKEVVASWFTGHVIIPDGKIVKYVHMGYASTYENYIILRVEKGVLIRNWTANTAAFIRFRDSQFAAYKKTVEYRVALAETAKEASKSEGFTAKVNEEFLREFYSETYLSMVFDKPQ